MPDPTAAAQAAGTGGVAPDGLPRPTTNAPQVPAGLPAGLTGAGPATIEIRPVLGLPELRPGDDLAGLLADAAPGLAAGDIVVVTSKAVSKVEGRLLAVPPDPVGRELARQAAIEAETVRLVASRGRTRIAQTRHGIVLASAGVDASNVRRDELALLPLDPDASASRLRAELRGRLGIDVAVVITDTIGRPWRLGLTDIAIGVAGMAALVDLRGSVDQHGNQLELTEVAVADEVAAAADLGKGKLAGVPAAIVRGMSTVDDRQGARSLVRPVEEDLFSLGTAEAMAAGRAEVLAQLYAAAWPPGDAATPGQIEAAFPTGAGCDFVLVPADTAADLLPALGVPTGQPTSLDSAPVALVFAALPADPPPSSWLEAGIAVERFRAALAVQSVASVLVSTAPDPSADLIAALDLLPGWIPVAAIAVRGA